MRLYALLLALALPLAALADGRAQAPLPTIRISAGVHLIKAEVADREPARARGLMFRPRLGPNEGMLFVFDAKTIQCMWMRNTLIPLSVAFIEDNGSIVNIEDMQPLTEVSHCAARPVRFALEMEKGWFARRGIGPGFKLTGLPVKP